MASNYYDMTGVLVLEKTTPVIKAVFGCYKLDETEPGDGGSEVYIAKTAEDNSVHWDLIFEALGELLIEWNVTTEDNPPADMEACLTMVAKHFRQAENPDLLSIVESGDFTEESDLLTLFDLALIFDDGHGLREIRTEGCWYCSKPWLFNFGGDGMYVSKNLTLTGNSTSIVGLGEQINTEIAASDNAKAAATIASHIDSILNGVNDEVVRNAIRVEVIRRMGEASMA
jgi:hypothetical protein